MRKLFALAASFAAALPAAAHAKAYVQIEAGLDSPTFYTSIPGKREKAVAFGGAVGYELPLGDRLFAGLEASIDDSTAKYCYTEILIDGNTGQICNRSGRDLGAVARLGTRIGRKSSVYLLAGYTNAQVRWSYIFSNGDRKSLGNDNANGFRVGAGYRLDITDHVFGKLEYRYSRYDKLFDRHNALAAVGVSF